MPDARLPSTPAGWAVALIASMIGFLSGFASLAILRKVAG